MKRSAIVMMMAAVLTGAAFAQNNVTPNLNQGTKTIEGSGSIDGDTPVGTDYNIQLSYGYFFFDNLELGGILGYRDNDDFSTYEIGARAEYNFPTETPLVPFVGAAVLWAGADADDSDKDEDTVVGRLSAGVKYFIDDNVALSFAAVYDMAGDDLYIDEDGDADDTNFKGVFGIQFYFD